MTLQSRDEARVYLEELREAVASGLVRYVMASDLGFAVGDGGDEGVPWFPEPDRIRDATGYHVIDWAGEVDLSGMRLLVYPYRPTDEARAKVEDRGETVVAVELTDDDAIATWPEGELRVLDHVAVRVAPRKRRRRRRSKRSAA